MDLIKEINACIDRNKIDSKIKEGMKNYILQLFNTEKIAPANTIKDFSKYILDMFENPNATREQKEGYLEYIINCIYKEGQKSKEKKC